MHRAGPRDSGGAVSIIRSALGPKGLVGFVVTVALVLVTGALTWHGTGPVRVPLDTVAASQESVQASRHERWLAEGAVPGERTRFAPMVSRALVDLRSLTADNGAALAGASSAWRYVWPRDASFVAAALAAAGHQADAAR